MEHIRNSGAVRVALSGHRRDHGAVLVGNPAYRPRHRPSTAACHANAGRDRLSRLVTQTGAVFLAVFPWGTVLLLSCQARRARGYGFTSLVVRYSLDNASLGQCARRPCSGRALDGGHRHWRSAELALLAWHCFLTPPAYASAYCLGVVCSCRMPYALWRRVPAGELVRAF